MSTLTVTLTTLSLGLMSLVAPEARKTLHDFSANSIEGDRVDLARYKGKKVLIVNVASACGYTPQYAELQQLHEQHGDKVTVLAFPSNDFGQQERGTNQEIKEFCQSKYRVTFPMFEKITVVGKEAHPLYRWLSSKSENGTVDQAPKWNFTKYLVDEKGRVVTMFPSGVRPLDPQILKAIGA